MYNLSIIIPHYNSVKTLDRLLNSIPKKKDIQIIVVDDKSNEQLQELSELINKYKRNVYFIKNITAKKGAGVCRNIGLEIATGKWILFADSDDYFKRTMYEDVSKFFTSEFNIVYFTPTSIDNETGLNSDRHIQYENLINNFLENPNRENKNNLKYKFHVPWSKLIRRDFIVGNSIQFDEVLASNDVMFSAKMGFYTNTFEVSKNIIYCSIRDKGSLTTQINEAVYDSRLKVWINYYNFLKDNLSKDEFKGLNIQTSGRGFLIKAVKYRFNIFKLINIYYQLRRNKLPIIDKKIINPLFLIRTLKIHYQQYKYEKKYYTK
ncbi:glycosyltransferase family 2 protein [Alkalibacterium pelagium]|uniref:Glycosyl transferase family 2 n=1 Tax=Alkalibacterium pelagium TaxID=426702 RepID=A0A1H7NR09_9LACT|nr:glycosyltransferase family 2 protein [Alkalibacterium pelagium]GEN51412.1 hypothetical protein APE02nite_20770 [Alkalibacterium pelagium]SEL25457.1 Glycosyl transferase family 2 [Alkalibacterium pelagium]